jgi:hypothetical protein
MSVPAPPRQAWPDARHSLTPNFVNFFGINGLLNRAMRIEPREDTAARESLVAQEVRRAHALGPAPDPVCCAGCPDYTRSAGCHRDCAAAPQRLSSEGERSPVEPRVAPLVFELKRLGVFYPCWSCEGHPGAAGEAWKIPRIWFYSDSVVHVRVLSEAIERLYAARRLAAHWQVALTHSDAANPDTTFSLEPDSPSDQPLSRLQGDLRILAEELGGQFWLACDALAARMR